MHRTHAAGTRRRTGAPAHYGVISTGVPRGIVCISWPKSAGPIRTQPREDWVPRMLVFCQPWMPARPPPGQLSRTGEKPERAKMPTAYGAAFQSCAAQTKKLPVGGGVDGAPTATEKDRCGARVCTG